MRSRSAHPVRLTTGSARAHSSGLLRWSQCSCGSLSSPGSHLAQERWDPQPSTSPSVGITGSLRRRFFVRASTSSRSAEPTACGGSQGSGAIRRRESAPTARRRPQTDGRLAGFPDRRRTPHPDADRIGVTAVAAKERRATVAAEPFLAAVLGPPHTKPVFARNDPKRARRGVRVRRRRRSTATLAALAMAIAGADERLGHLESHGAAVAATPKREVASRSGFPRVGAGHPTNTTAAVPPTPLSCGSGRRVGARAAGDRTLAGTT